MKKKTFMLYDKSRNKVVVSNKDTNRVGWKGNQNTYKRGSGKI